MTLGPSAVSLLAAVSRRAARSPGPFLAACAALVAVSLALASTLTVRSSMQELLPEDVPSVASILELQRRVGGDGTVLVNVESLDGPAGLPRAEQLAAALAPEFLGLGADDVRSVEWELNSTRQWYAAHWPLFASLEELISARDAVRSEVRRRTLEQNPLALELDAPEPAEVPEAVAGVIDLAQPSPRARVEREFARYQDGYLVHPDRSSVTILLRPARSSTSLEDARALLRRLRAVADGHRAELDAQRLRVGFGGTFPHFVAEYEDVIADAGIAGLVTGIIVLASMILFFRDLRSTLALGGCVFAAVAINFGLTRLTIGYLNTQTAFLGSIVAGDGLNYGLIYLARVRQLRRAGVGLVQACEDAARTTATGTFLAALATSAAFATLVIAANRGFHQFGIIGGVGMMLCWISAFTLAPAFLAVFEKLRPVRPSPQDAAARRGRLVAEHVFARPGLVLAGFAVAALAATAVAVSRAPEAMELNLQKMGNQLRGRDELRRDHRRAQEAIGRSITGAMALLDSPAHAEEYCERVRERMRDPRWSALIQGCETVASVVPLRQREKLAVIREIRAELTDARLARVAPGLRARLREIRADLAAQHEVSNADAPPSLVDRFRERDGTVGRIAIVTAQGGAMLELGPNLRAFADGVRQVPVGDGLADATGENVVFADLLSNIEREGPRTTLVSFLGVCAVILLVLRERTLSLQVIGTLVAGVVLMAGITAAADLKINFFNFIAYPITFGISSDYGANISTRVRERAGRVVESVLEVGPAVAMCSWSTVVGYGSLLFSMNSALRSFAWYAMIGEVTTLSSGVLMLPALLLLQQRRSARAAGPVSLGAPAVTPRGTRRCTPAAPPR